MELQGRMRHLQQSIGPPIGPDGRPMMMGPNGPMPRPPPNHPIMMEMQALDQHLRSLHQQPQSPETQQKVTRAYFYRRLMFLTLFSLQIRELQDRMRSLQNTLAQQWGPPGGPPPPGMMGPGPHGAPRMMGPGPHGPHGPHGPPPPHMVPQQPQSQVGRESPVMIS